MIGPLPGRRLPVATVLATGILVALCLTAAGTHAVAMTSGSRFAPAQPTVAGATHPMGPPQLQPVGQGNTIGSLPSPPPRPQPRHASTSWPEIALVAVAVVIVLIALFNRRSSGETPRRRGDPPRTPPSRKQRALGH